MKIVNIAIITAIIVAAVAAWFSVVGLMAIFAGSAISIAIFGGVIECAKLVTASFLKTHWNDVPKKFSWPLVGCVVFLMCLTSMGTFGYLSKAHSEQSAEMQPTILKLERLELQIAREQKIIDDSTKVVSQLDTSVQKLMDNDRIRGSEGAITVRKSQVAERGSLNSDIASSQATVDKLLDEKLTLDQSLQEYEAHVGPVKYLAQVIYGSTERDVLDKAVRFVIILLVIVFDPLAVLLLLAANHVLAAQKAMKADKEVVEVVSNIDDQITTDHADSVKKKKKVKKKVEKKQDVEASVLTSDNTRSPIKGIPVRPISQ